MPPVPQISEYSRGGPEKGCFISINVPQILLAGTEHQLLPSALALIVLQNNPTNRKEKI
jgi:hypothetical protein